VVLPPPPKWLLVKKMCDDSEQRTLWWFRPKGYLSIRFLAHKLCFFSTHFFHFISQLPLSGVYSIWHCIHLLFWYVQAFLFCFVCCNYHNTFLKKSSPHSNYFQKMEIHPNYFQGGHMPTPAHPVPVSHGKIAGRRFAHRRWSWNIRVFAIYSRSPSGRKSPTIVWSLEIRAHDE